MFARLFNGLAAIAGAATSAQFPEFVQQYLQRLGGRLDQTHDDLQRLLADAQALGRTLEAYLDELMASGSEVARQTAARELERLEQAERLERAYYALRDALPLERPLAFVEHFDAQIAQDTLAAFKPAMPINAEGFVYAGIGMLLGLTLLAGSERSGRAVGRGVRRRLRRHRSAATERARPRFRFQTEDDDEDPVAPGRPPLRVEPAAAAEERREPSLRYGDGQHG